MIGILVVDDHQVVRDAFGALLSTQPDFRVIGTAADGAAAVRLSETLPLDVVIMDVRMPVMDGIEATRRIVAANTNIRPRILMLTTFDLDDHIYDALRSGASGFLLKDVTGDQLFHAVRVIAAGEGLLAPTVTRRLIGEFARLSPRTRRRDQIRDLTAREIEVLKLIAEGLSNPEIAGRLTISEETVKTHVSRVLNKLGLRDRTQAVVAAYQSGLVVPGERMGAGACCSRQLSCHDQLRTSGRSSPVSRM